jgi:hypothetical protein
MKGREQILDSLDAAEPPAGLSTPLRGLWWLRKGGLGTGPEWERAHEICQAEAGTRGCDLVHALVHLIEGDTGNAAYWYRRAGSRRAGGPASEWERIAGELGG